MINNDHSDITTLFNKPKQIFTISAKSLPSNPVFRSTPNPEEYNKANGGGLSIIKSLEFFKLMEERRSQKRQSGPSTTKTRDGRTPHYPIRRGFENPTRKKPRKTQQITIKPQDDITSLAHPSTVWYRLGRNRNTRHPPRTMLTRASSRLSEAAIGAGPVSEVAAFTSLAVIKFASIQMENTTTSTLNNVQFTSSLQSRRARV